MVPLSRKRERKKLEVYRYAFAFPVAEAGGFKTLGAAVFVFALGRRLRFQAAGLSLFQSAAGGWAQRLVSRGVWRKVVHLFKLRPPR